MSWWRVRRQGLMHGINGTGNDGARRSWEYYEVVWLGLDGRGGMGAITMSIFLVSMSLCERSPRADGTAAPACEAGASEQQITRGPSAGRAFELKRMWRTVKDDAVRALGQGARLERHLRPLGRFGHRQEAPRGHAGRQLEREIEHALAAHRQRRRRRRRFLPRRLLRHHHRDRQREERPARGVGSVEGVDGRKVRAGAERGERGRVEANREGLATSLLRRHA